MTYNSAHHCPASREILFRPAISASQEYSTLIGCCLSVISCLIAVLNKYTSRQFYSSQTIIMVPGKMALSKK